MTKIYDPSLRDRAAIYQILIHYFVTDKQPYQYTSKKMDLTYLLHAAEKLIGSQLVKKFPAFL